MRDLARILARHRGGLLVTYAIALALAAVGMAVGFGVAGVALGSPYAVLTLVALALVAERQSIRLSPSLEVSASSLVFLFAAVVYGPLAAMLVGAAGLLVDFGRPYLRWAVWTGVRAVVAGLAGAVALGFDTPKTHSFWILLGAVTTASLVEAVADLGLNSVAPFLRGTASIRNMARDLGPLLMASVPLHVPVLAVLSYAYMEISPWSAILFIVPAFAAQRLFLLYRQQRETAEELGKSNERLQRANISFATALVTTLDARDQYTAGHSAAVAVYSRDIAARMGLSEEDQQLAHLCGLVHDIGKIGLTAGVLEKPGPLTLEERRHMETHSEIGERILAKVEDYAEVAKIVRHHHERMDGMGYPDGIPGAEIPLIARIIAVADAYNAMTSDRPYRDAMPSRVARLRLAQAVDGQFDTSVVAAFEAILATADESYRVGQRADFFIEERIALSA